MESVKYFDPAEGGGVIEADGYGAYVSAEDFDRVTAEREALQLMLNEREEQNHSLEQRRHAEQQACQAAERRVEELGLELEGVTYRLEVMTADRDELLRKLEVLRVFAEQMARQEGEPYFARLAESALNPTAEAVSHDE